MINRIREFVLANALLILGVFAALMTVGFAVQTIRIDGFQIDPPFFKPIGPKGLIAERDAALDEVAKLIDERNAAVLESKRIAEANTAATQKADTDVEQNLEQERAGADAFIAAGGVRRCPSTRTYTTPAGQGPIVDAGAGALPVVDDVPVVTVLPEDVRICTENTVKARAWQEWGLAIEANQKTQPSE